MEEELTLERVSNIASYLNQMSTSLYDSYQDALAFGEHDLALAMLLGASAIGRHAAKLDQTVRGLNVLEARHRWNERLRN